MHSVTVMMSTYNGEKFLREQIDSILAQVGVKVDLLVRDDGSSDGTVDILQAYADEGKLQWYRGGNLKPAYSFLDLIKNVPENEYYAFSDQDDVWDEDKLFAATNKLEEYAPQDVVLYTCNVRVVSSDLKEIGSLDSSIPVTTFIDGLIRNNSQGCTMVFGNPLKKLLMRYDGKNLFMHDDLAVKVCLAVGGVVYRDPKKYMSYRQHGKNVIGSRESFRHSLKRRIRVLLSQSCERSRELQDIAKIYSNQIVLERMEILEKIAFYKKKKYGRWNVLADKRIKAKNKKTTWHFRVAVLLGFF